jgi:SPP1 gp7 family putative phage head morphogenesis protein
MAKTKPKKPLDPGDFRLAFDLPPADAMAFLSKKGYAITWDWKELEPEAHNHAFTVAKAMSAEILTTIKESLEEAQRSGKPMKQWRDELTPKLEAAGWIGKKTVLNPNTGKAEEVTLGTPWRLATIYRTNLQSAYQAGRYKQQTKLSQSRPYWQYIAIGDNRGRPYHTALSGKVLRADDPFWRTAYPPNGYNCRCRVRTLSERELQREGLEVEDGETLEVEIPKKGGGKERVPFKPDAGFAGNPAGNWGPDLKRYPADIRKALAGELENVPYPNAGTTGPAPAPAAKDGPKSEPKSEPKPPEAPLDPVEALLAEMPTELREAGDKVAAADKARLEALREYGRRQKDKDGGMEAYKDYAAKRKAHAEAMAEAVKLRGDFAGRVHALFFKDKPAEIPFSHSGGTKAERAKAEEVLGWLARIVGEGGIEFKKGALTFKYSSSPTKRAHARQDGTLSLAKNEDPRTIAHEITHVLEWGIPGAYDAAVAFRERRTAGESWQSLNKLAGPGHRSGEVAKPDKFLHPYIGKGYPPSHRTTEVLTMGIEYLYAEPERLLLEDPDLFRLLLTVFGGK